MLGFTDNVPFPGRAPLGAARSAWAGTRRSSWVWTMPGRVALLVLAMMLAGCGGSATSAPGTAADTPERTEAVVPIDDPLAGTIEFGNAYDESTLEIVKPASTFKVKTKTIAYVAHLSEPAGAKQLTLSMVRRAAGGAETAIFSQDFSVASPEYDTLANSADLVTLAGKKAGAYILRVTREGDTLAEGIFTVVK